MKKNKGTIEILAHIVAWLIFLFIPFLLMPEPPPGLNHDFGKFRFLTIFSNSLFLILLFYINYFVLIPAFLFTNRYITYIFTCVACIALKLFFPFLVMHLTNHQQNPLQGDFPHINSMMFPLAIGNSVMMSAVILLASIGLRLNKRWKLTEKEKLQSELSALKSQVNPHFLFNTLNSIYAETLGKADNASEMILKLSDLMRYTITEAHYDKVSVQKEFNYIINYIELQKLRLPPKVNLKYRISGDANDSEIAPLLLIPFIENAFKHGVNPEQISSIEVSVDVDSDQIHLLVSNRKVDTDKTLLETTGLGVENTRQRLNLIYGGKHTLKISENDNFYSISLQINLG